MTTIRRAAQVVEDLRTLGVITVEKIFTRLSLDEQDYSIVVNVSKNNRNVYYTISTAFVDEFPEAKIIEDSEFLQILVRR